MGVMRGRLFDVEALLDSSERLDAPGEARWEWDVEAEGEEGATIGAPSLRVKSKEVAVEGVVDECRGSCGPTVFRGGIDIDTPLWL